MDEQGLPFEQFSFLAEHRRQELGRPVDTRGAVKIRVDGVDSTIAIADPYAYVKTLAESRHVQQVFLRHVFRFFMGRNETLADANTLIAMESAYAPSGSLKAAVKTLLMSDSFRIRQPKTSKEESPQASPAPKGQPHHSLGQRPR